MSLEVSINLNSLRVIQEELGSTIDHSATEFEAYLANQNNSDHLQACRDGIAQVHGIFRLLEFPGATLLTEEIALLIDVISDSDRKTTDAMINALTHGYFVLPRYIEFISTNHKELPLLVIPYVNELRITRREQLLPESFFYTGDIPLLGMMATELDAADIKLLLASAPRLRQMYQTGLVGVFKDPNSKPHYVFLTRAVNRVVKLMGNHSHAEIWRLSLVVIEAFAAGKLEMTINRKRNLGEIEKLMRLIINEGEDGFSQADTQQLKKDLLFMLMLSRYQSNEMTAIRQGYTLPVLDINDDDIARQRATMHGPSLETIESVIKVLGEELRNAKDILEMASQKDGIDGEDLDMLLQIITRIADTLSILNLHGPRDTLKLQLEKIRLWSKEPAQRKDYIDAANSLLYIESALGSLNRQELTINDLNAATELTRKKIIASSQFAQAEQLVIQEAQVGIGMIKRAITSYVESNFDTTHIANIGVTLNTARGGMYMLGYQRAAIILNNCCNFVAHHIEESTLNDQRHQLLETLADALISLEYYLIELETSRDVDENILKIAEESLQALGFGIDTPN